MSKSGSDTKTEDMNNCMNLQLSCQPGKPPSRGPRKKHQAITCAGAKSRSIEGREEIAVIGNCMLVKLRPYQYTVFETLPIIHVKPASIRSFSHACGLKSPDSILSLSCAASNASLASQEIQICIRL